MWSDKEKGQTLLIVVLVMIVSLTVGLAAVSRSITNLRTSTEEASSQAAFSAAEAGVERLIKSTETFATGGFTENSSSFNASATSIAGTEFLVNNGDPVSKDDGADIWLSHYPDHTIPLTPNFFSIYWGSSSDNCATSPPAAIEVIVISGSKNSPIAKRYAYDPCPSRRSGNNFTEPETGPYNILGQTFQYRTPLTGSQRISITEGLIMRVVPLYANTPMGVKTCNPAGLNCTSLPSQGSIISSTGTSGTTTRKITLFQGYSRVPLEFFQYVLFSPR